MENILFIFIGILVGIGVSYPLSRSSVALNHQTEFNLERCIRIKRLLLEKAQKCDPAIIDPSELFK